MRPHSYFYPTTLLVFLPVFACDCDEGLVDAKARFSAAPELLDFGEVQRGDLRVKPLELANRGLSPVNIQAFELSSATGEFAFASPVPRVLSANEVIQFNVVYEPDDLGPDEAVIEIRTEGAAPQLVRLRGVGVEGGVTVTTEGESCADEAGSLAFGNVVPGSSAERRLTVSAMGTYPVNVLSAVVEPGASGEWSIDGSGLPKSLAPGESLELVTRYAPVDGGPDRGAFIVTTDSPATPTIRVAACGSGVAPALCATPIPLDLGAVAVGQTESDVLRLESCGLEPLRIDSIAIASDSAHATHPGFSMGMVGGLPSTLSPGSTLDVPVSFASNLPYGPASGWVEVRSNALGNSQAFFPLEARVAQPCGLMVAPAQLDFHNVAAGSRAEQAILVANDGESVCNVTALSVSNTGGGMEFSLANPPQAPFSIQPGDSRVLMAAYAPASAGPHEGEVVVESTGARHTVRLRGNPPIAEECTVEVVPSVVSFGAVAAGSMSRQVVEVRNIGEEACRLRSAALVNSSTAFSVSVPMTRIMVPNVGSASIGVTYAPPGSGSHFDMLQIEVEGAFGAAGGGTFLVGLNGSAAEARLCVTPARLDFGVVPQGGSSSQTLTITSCGAAEVTLRGVLMSSASTSVFQITQAPASPALLPSGSTAMPVLTVSYGPTGAGPHFGEIEILSTDPQNGVLRVPLSGNWDGTCTRILSCTPSDIEFGNTDVGSTKVLRVVCRNAGTDFVSISSASLTGANPDMSLVTSTPVNLAPGGRFTADVRYTPSAVGADSTSLSIVSDACVGPAAIPVSGIGQIVPLPPCQAPTTFSPVTQWEWHGSSIEPDLNNVWMTPLVANLTDDNGDTRIDENDVPEVIFVSYDQVPLSDANQSRPGVLRVLSGDTGAERFSVTNPRFADAAQLAVGDLEGDGTPEIIGFKWVQTPMGTGTGNFMGRYTTGQLAAVDHRGRLLWESDPFSWPQEVMWNAASISLADLDADGFSEIVVGREVFDHRGRLLWRGQSGHGMTQAGPQSVVVDLDLDGRPEVIAGGTVYQSDGTVLWEAQGAREGGSAVGMFDPSDPYPRIVVQWGNQLTVLDHLGNEVWSDYTMTAGPTSNLPVVADFDGDGDADFAVADGEGVYVYAGTGGLIWSGVVMDSTCCPGLSGFDFEGDGGFELLLHDLGNIYMYRGNSGQSLYSASRPNVTNFEIPVVADIDNDRKAELVVALQSDFGSSGGVIAYSNVGDSWVSAPRIWNQQSFYVNNVTEAGTIPRVMTPFPDGPGVFRATAAACQ